MNAQRRRLATHRTGVEIAHAADDVALLPWYATGRLSERDAARIGMAICKRSELARQAIEITRECAEIVALDEALGAPSPQVLCRLFAAIDADEERPVRAGPAVQVLHPKPANSNARQCAAPRAIAKKIGYRV